ncbi:MAG: ribonuclease E inhibitor RraB [Candidatus Dormibacteraeota bacterium]|nr:ribonuclease E inhibitor RraB [Candidatus Dormibacteraeota bacterium]
MDWLGWFIPRGLLHRPVTESLAPPDPADLSQLDELRALGSRLELPHPVSALLEFANEKEALSAVEALGRDGFACKVRALRDGRWSLRATSTLIPTPGTITRLRERLSVSCEALNGTYLGWDAPPVY